MIFSSPIDSHQKKGQAMKSGEKAVTERVTHVFEDFA
jgi:hypothetical protein